MPEHAGSHFAEDLKAEVLRAGALRAAAIEGEDIVLSVAFRDICAANQCGLYGKCWVCPPAAGDIEILMSEVRSYPAAVLYQTVDTLEDSFDFEGMTAAKQKHVRLGQRIERVLKEKIPGSYLHLSTGGCGLCARCAMADEEPCRFPDKALSSLEAYGIDVYQTTCKTPLKYINGQNTVTYFGLILYRE